MPEESFFTVREKSHLPQGEGEPGARQDAVLGVRGPSSWLPVRAVAEKGKANEEIAHVIARRSVFRGTASC